MRADRISWVLHPILLIQRIALGIENKRLKKTLRTVRRI
jgi:hypothetical protein